MDQSIRNKLRGVVTQCRKLLEEAVSQVLQGQFGIYASGKKDEVHVEDEGRMKNLSEEDKGYRRDIQAHLGHIEALGYTAKDSLAQLVREIAFTHLNRLCAYKMMEARAVWIGGKPFRESVSRGMKSQGFQFYLADHAEDKTLFDTGHQDVAYRHFLGWLGALLSEEIGVLFSPTDPANRLFPPQRVLDDVLALLNGDDLKDIWTVDETIGWVYQYFTPKELRDQVRKESAAPRNSYELAFRNQFFTPRYVVEFLTDNTLGRIWYEMRKGDTKLKDQCRYMVRRPSEVFLAEGQTPPEPTQNQDHLSQDELLNQPVHIPHRIKKFPRELRILDPACGSGHFLLYCFDLLLTIYEEAYADPDLGPTLKEEYPTLEVYRRDVPRLILAHNLHGIDIDLRASQIAALALWLRCQRAYRMMELKQDRPRITKSNFVCAEPMPGESEMLKEFVADLQPKVLGHLVEIVFDKMKLAGEAGSLLKIEEELRVAIADVKKKWLAETDRATDRKGQSLLFSVAEMDRLSKNSPQPQLFDLAEITDEQFWNKAEGEVLAALRNYSAHAANGGKLKKQLFAEDAERGFAFIDLCQKRFDVVLMNPPFGEPIKATSEYLARHYNPSKHDLFAAFCDRGLDMLTPLGVLGEISSRVGFFIRSFEAWRESLLNSWHMRLLADLGSQVLDTAAVEAACYVIGRKQSDTDVTTVYRLLVEDEKAEHLADAVKENSPDIFVLTPDKCRILPLHPFIYWIPSQTLRKFAAHVPVEPAAGVVRQGLGTGDNFRFVRTLWEVSADSIAGHGCTTPIDVRQQLSDGKVWAIHVRSGASQPWYSPLTVVIDWEDQGRRLKDHWRSKGQSPSRYIPSEDLYFRPGLSWTLRAFRLIPYIVPTGCIPSASRYMAFPNDECRIDLLGLASSIVATAFMRFYGEAFERPKHLVDTFKRLPFVSLSADTQKNIRSLAEGEVNKRKQVYRNHEPFSDFVMPAMVKQWGEGEGSEWNLRSLLGDSLEGQLASAMGLSAEELKLLLRDLDEAIQVRRRGQEADSEQAEQEDGEDTADSDCDTSPRGYRSDVLSYALGCGYGRWDIRMSADDSLVPQLGDPFAPIDPFCPGRLLSPNGRPAQKGKIASRNWLRGRSAVSGAIPEVSQLDAFDTDYPLNINWDGIIPDDADHSDDIVRRVREVLELIWKDRAEAIEKDACEILGVKGLRDYFRKPGKGGFWDDHVSRYSKSRRKAPIYWLLQSSKKNYGLWLYYHRLDKDILFKARQNYVDPKIRLEQTRLDSLRSQKSALGTDAKGAKKIDKDIERQDTLLGELKDFADKLERAAKLNFGKQENLDSGVQYDPDLNDGVVLNIAPLWELVPWKEAKNYWEELLEGKYEWSSMGKLLRKKGLVK